MKMNLKQHLISTVLFVLSGVLSGKYALQIVNFDSPYSVYLLLLSITFFIVFIIFLIESLSPYVEKETVDQKIQNLKKEKEELNIKYSELEKLHYRTITKLINKNNENHNS